MFRKLQALRARNLSTSIDANELKHFKQFTAEWWDEFGVFKPLHSLNKLRIPFIRDGLANTGALKPEKLNKANCLENIKILDIGCGGGILSEPLARLGATVSGIDPNADIIEKAKQHAQASRLANIEYSASSIEEHAARNRGKYDAIFASEVLEHVNEKEMFLSACVECLKPGGSIFITTMNKTFLADVCGIYLAENVLQLTPVGTHEIEKFIEPHRLQRILEDSNCRTVLVHGLGYNPFTNNWCWTQNTSINYGLHAVKLEE